MKQRHVHRAAFLALAVIYLLIFLYMRSTPFYDVTSAHNDRLFSADDHYYVTEYFSAQIDDSPRIIKHPLLVLFGSLFTRMEGLVFGEVSIQQHYEHIVLLQMGLALLSVFYLYRILTEQYDLRQRDAVLLCAIYAFAFSTVFYTFVAESYINSALVLIMSFYYARRGNAPVTALLGVLAAGVTITNAALWAIIVLCTNSFSLLRKVQILAAGGLVFCVLMALSPLRGIFYSTLISGALSSAHNYSDHFSLGELIRRVFFVFFGSTAFALDTMESSPFGEFPGDALSFIPHAGIGVVLAALVWVFLLAAAVWLARKQPLLYAPLAVLGANLVLHGVIQYGLKEGFLYSLHHLPAQILLVALLLRPETKTPLRRAVPILLSGYLLCELVINFPAYQVFLAFTLN